MFSKFKLAFSHHFNSFCASLFISGALLFPFYMKEDGAKILIEVASQVLMKRCLTWTNIL